LSALPDKVVDAAARPLKILFVTSELAPLVKTGGLGDVAGALPKALHALGHDVRVALPCYGMLPENARGESYCMCVADFGGFVEHGALRQAKVPGTEVPLYLIEHHGFFGRGEPYGYNGQAYPDNLRRFCFFALAVLDAIPQTKWTPDVVHCHDWHTAALPIYLKTRFKTDPHWGKKPTLFTIHNLAYQGRFGKELWPDTGLPSELFRPDVLEYFGDLNLMKGAIRLSSMISTVSRRHAKEIQTAEFGAGLDGELRERAHDLTGILNGVDYSDWNPEHDKHILKNYSAENMQGKSACKRALQKKLGLSPSDAPLFGMVTRFDWQKGLDLVAAAIDEMLLEDIQVVILGTGDPQFETLFAEKAQIHKDTLRVLLKFDVGISHEIQAASDFYIMPSHYEPSGLSQLYALAYGAVPIVRRTGGLGDSIVDASPTNLKNGRATGIVFSQARRETFLHGFREALGLYASPEQYRAVQLTGMKRRYTWEQAAESYVRLYHRAIAHA
jgi:starch synthase